MIETSFMAPDLQTEIDALLHAAGFALLADRAFLRVAGADATRWLNGMVTNSAGALAPGEGNYNFLLSAQGRIQGDGILYREPDDREPAFVLASSGSQIATLQPWLDRYIIMDDVELTPVLENRQTLLLAGPEAHVILRALGGLLGDDHSTMLPLRLTQDRLSGNQVTTPAAGLVPRFEIRADSARLDTLAQSALANGAMPVSAEALEALRILEATPRFGTDIHDRDLPQETNQTHALHFSKGCYLGQEIVERIRSRGQVHRSFSPFRLEGSLPVLPVGLEAGGKPVGELTSVAEVPLPSGPVLLALGYARREAIETHAEITYPGGFAIPRTAERPS